MIDTPSDKVWDYLNKRKMNTRGEATDLFASAVLSVIVEEHNRYSNGNTIDALESALNQLVNGSPEREKLLGEYIQELEELDDE